MKQYHDLVRYVLDNGTRKENRTGVDTLSAFNYNYTIDLKDGFPLLTTKKISWKSIVVEMLWFLSGQTNIDILKRHKCGFWDPWADPETGEVPSAYGSFWRGFPTLEGPNDQIRYVLDELRRNPMSRRLVVSAWAPDNAQTSKLPPCHAMFAFNVQQTRMDTPELDSVCERLGAAKGVGLRENIMQPTLNLHLFQRSCDVFVGAPFNIASYSLLIHLFSRFTGIAPGKFSHSIVDVHLYTSKPDGSMSEYDHVPSALVQLSRKPKPLPKLVISDKIKDLSDVEALMHPSVTTEDIMSHFVLEGYDPWPALTAKVAV